MDKYNQAIADSQVITDDAQVAAKVNEILEKHLEENRTPEVLRQLFNCIDPVSYTHLTLPTKLEV